MRGCVGGFLKEAPKPPRTFHKFVIDGVALVVPKRRGFPLGACSYAALAIPAPGERTISNAEVPLPRSPLSLAGGTAHREHLSSVLAANRGYSPGDARGEAPCIRKQ